MSLGLLLALLLVPAHPSYSRQGRGSGPESGLSPAGLRCEYLVDPLGIDRVRPRLSWILVDRRAARGQKQAAYRIIVASSRRGLEDGLGDLWDTGKVPSGRTNHIEYDGKALTAKAGCYWKVRIWDADDRASAWSQPALWTMGLLRDEDWKAEWIGTKPVASTGDDGKDRAARLMTPSPLLRKTFTARAAASRATMHVTALGLYEVRLNGVKVGDHVLAPEWTDYRKRVQYQTYDVTSLIRRGENVVAATLADGWYIGPVGTFADPAHGRGKNYGSLDRRLLLQLEVTGSDGQVEQVVSDGSWRVQPDGPVRSADIYQGEAFDSRKAPRGWDRPGFDDSRWGRAVVHPALGIRRVAQMHEPVRVVKTLRPVAVTELRRGTYVFDMGQNMAGWCSLEAAEPSGREIVLRYGEALDASGGLYTANLRGAKATDRFVADGRGIQSFAPRFTYHGFRYVEVTGLRRRPAPGALIGQAVSSSVRAAGRFECSHPGLNKLWRNILWTQRNNLIGVPTDCPQRDERLGWLGDAQVFSQTAMLNSDMAAFFTKWSQDIRDAQTSEGQYPDMAPQPPALSNYGAPGWADAGIIVPWKVYENYGDRRILQENYPSAKRFVDYVRRKNPSLNRLEAVGGQYGDWLNGSTLAPARHPKGCWQAQVHLVNTVYFAVSARLLSRTAAVLGHEDDAERYARLSDDIQAVLAKEYLDSDAALNPPGQAGYALLLGLAVLPEGLRPRVFEHLLSGITACGSRLSTGILSTSQLMDALVSQGRADIAYELLLSRQLPSWLYQVDQGATTVWERWDGYVRERGFREPELNSLDHWAFGAVGEWMYKHIAGIQWGGERPGYEEFVIRPQIGGGLTWADGAYSSIRGEIVSRWRLAGGILGLHVEIPPNTRARVYVPARDKGSVREGGKDLDAAPGVRFLGMEGPAAVCELGSGVYDFTSDFPPLIADDRRGRAAPELRPGVRGAPPAAVKEETALAPTADAAGAGEEGAQRGRAGILWVAIPGGDFVMGSGAEADWSWAQPAHRVTVKPFQMAKTLVTNAQYRECVRAGACAASDKAAIPGDDDRPVVGVDWDRARAFSEWVGGRLPSEAEWEYAARSAGEDRKYPWGDGPATDERAVIRSGRIAPVCSKPAGNTKQGLCDMAGNAWQWVQDWYHDSYDGAPTDGSAWEIPPGSSRVLRGGSWYGDAWVARSAYRTDFAPGDRYDCGFRPAR